MPKGLCFGGPLHRDILELDGKETLNFSLRGAVGHYTTEENEADCVPGRSCFGVFRFFWKRKEKDE